MDSDKIKSYQSPGEDKIKAKCLTLAKLMLKEGSPYDKREMAVILVKRAFKCGDRVKQAKEVYDWLTKNKVDGAWEASGMGALVANDG